jgi:hypothetical protein
VPLQWSGNTNFIYEKGLIGVPVGAPLPTIIGNSSWSTLVSSDGTTAPFGTIIISEWVLGTSCTTVFNEQIDNYYNALYTYLQDSITNANSNPPVSNPSPPDIDTYLKAADKTCSGSGQPHVASAFGCKIVVYQYDSHGNPIFAVVPLTWTYTGEQI